MWLTTRRIAFNDNAVVVRLGLLLAVVARWRLCAWSQSPSHTVLGRALGLQGQALWCVQASCAACTAASTCCRDVAAPAAELWFAPESTRLLTIHTQHARRWHAGPASHAAGVAELSVRVKVTSCTGTAGPCRQAAACLSFVVLHCTACNDA
ncbi:hypothetical protein COO60DRAFT_939336 [Scenedesmus sp. NREL 46B-D3]|nr:hypothetical protein COO60DRAFT_939336 [Scenedesmus sp. NREL 46B-D3]